MQPTIEHVPQDCLIYPYNRLTGLYHLHTSFEVVAPRSGRIRVRLDDREHDVEPGDLLVVFPGVAHAYAQPDDGDGTILIFSPKMLSSLETDWTEMQPARPVVRLDDVHPDVRYCTDRLHAVAVSENPDGTLIRAYLSLIFFWLIPALSPEKTSRLVTKDVLYRAMEYMSQNYQRRLDIRATARALGVNTYYLSHILNQKLRMGFRAYLNALRIDQARRYLRGTSWPIEEISAVCGFANLRTFDRVFFERCGCTPRDFRKSMATVQGAPLAHDLPYPDAGEQ